ncbi:MAG: flavodoxin family protein [Candidatus Methanoplasma sp.]|jgi:multimeric flavodoxin WrbA|nr:flavodoxin family protein [Candidatus Methanoplasma sp.]
MKMLLINGSPRDGGNTSELARRFTEAVGGKADVEEVRIFGKNIRGCSNCGACQHAVIRGHCTIDDDMSSLYPEFIAADLIVLASPIYMWQFTPCTLAFLNRLHCLCQSRDFKYNEMAGKKMAVLVTSGDEEEVADFAVNGIRDFCEFFSIDYRGDLRIPFADKGRIGSGEYDAELEKFVSEVLG